MKESRTTVIFCLTIMACLYSLTLLPFASGLRNPGGVSLYWYLDLLINLIVVVTASVFIIRSPQPWVRASSLFLLFFAVYILWTLALIHRHWEMWGLATQVECLEHLHEELRAEQAIKSFDVEPFAGLIGNPGTIGTGWYLALSINWIAIVVYSTSIICNPKIGIRTCALFLLFLAALSLWDLSVIHRKWEMAHLAMTVHSMKNPSDSPGLFSTVRDFEPKF